jgi:hypothetical protein
MNSLSLKKFRFLSTNYFNFSHHIKHVDKTQNRSDKQDKDKFPIEKPITDDEHMFDEVYAKGRGGNRFEKHEDHVKKDKVKQNVNEQVNEINPPTK